MNIKKKLKIKLELVGIGFGTIWVDVIIREVIANTNISISLLMDKHFRDKKYFKLGICYQRGRFISLIYLIVITPFIGFSEFFLKLIGLKE